MNRERCEQVLQWIEAHPEHWDQEVWHCGTSHCFAGVAEMMRLKIDPKSTICTMIDGQLADEAETAHWLGFLVFTQPWDRLISTQNTIDDLRRIIRGTP